MRRARVGVVLVGALVSGVVAFPVRGAEPVPGVPLRIDEDQPVLTHDECARGGRDGVTLYGSGQGSTCVTAGGHVMAYAAGSPTCGAATVADQRLDKRDPNTCPQSSVPMVRHHLPLHRPDGAVLDGYVWLRKDLAGTQVPIVLTSSPYFGSYYPPLHSVEAVDQFLIRAGYGVAVYSVRGTGTSGGCFELFGVNEQRDQSAIVEALAAQRYSTGAIGMVGHSYDAATATQAAVAAPPALRAVITSGNLVDPYLLVSTPEGAARTTGHRGGTDARVGFYPVAAGMVRHGLPRPPLTEASDDPGEGPNRFLNAVAQRACRDVAAMAASAVDINVTDDRNEQFWDERRLTERLGKVQAAMLVTHGFDDGHFYQEDEMWEGLRRAPKRMLLGQWGHSFPPDDRLRDAPWAGRVARADGQTVQGFDRVKLEWFDHWLRQSPSTAKQNADQVRAGVVDHQASDGGWYEATSWPPRGADLALEVAGTRLVAAGRAASGPARQFVSAPDAVTTAVGANEFRSEYAPFAGAMCGDAGLTWETQELPASTTWHLAGNPTLEVTYESSQPGGLVMWQLVDMAPGAACSAGTPVGSTGIARAGMDLRFRHGNYTAEGPHPGRREAVRVRFYNDSYVLAPGHRLALVAGYGDVYDRSTHPRFTPMITVHGAKLVLRVLEQPGAPGRSVPPVNEGDQRARGGMR